MEDLHKSGFSTQKVRRKMEIYDRRQCILSIYLVAYSLAVLMKVTEQNVQNHRGR